MSDIAIKVENLSKAYRIGLESEQHDTFRDMLAAWVKSPVENYRRLRRLTRISEDEEADDLIWALRDVSFTVERGEVLGIIGRNGAGKSTLLKVLSRITEPTSGRAIVNGRVASLLEVGTGFHQELTGRENVYMNGTLLGMTKAEVERKFDEIVAFSGVEKFIDTPIKRYSSGMKVRLAFAVAAHLDPEILLVDEVLAVGDAAFQKKCLGKMDEVAHSGRTVLFVSHDMTAVESLCPRTLLIEQGTIAISDKSQSVIQHYLSNSTAAGMKVNPGYFDLTSRKNRYHPDHLFARSITILNSEGVPSETVRMGSKMQIVVKTEGLHRFPSPEVGIIIKNTTEQWITSINTGMTGTSYPPVRSECEYAILHIPQIPLTPGDYVLDVSIALRGSTRIDYVNHAASFTIVESDVYGTGYRITNYFGHFYLQGEWQVTTKEPSLLQHA